MAFSLSKSARYCLEADPIERSDGVHEAEGLRFAVAAVATLLRRQVHEDVLAQVLLHALVSIDEPRRDRVHFRLKWRGEVRPFRDVVSLLANWPKQFIGGAIERIETGTHWFDVDARDAFAKVVSIYTIDYSNFMPYAPTVRRRFFKDPPEVQQDFLRAFLSLYDEGTDVTHMPGADEAAEWLRGHRVCRAQQTLVLRDDLTVRAVDVAEVERELREALAAFAAVIEAVQRTLVSEFRTMRGLDNVADQYLPTDTSHLSRTTKRLLTATADEHHVGLVEVLTVLQVPPGQIALSALARACASLIDEPMPYDPKPVTQVAMPLLLAAQERLKVATMQALALAC